MELRSEEFKTFSHMSNVWDLSFILLLAIMQFYGLSAWREYLHIFSANNWVFIICVFCLLVLRYIMLFIRNCSTVMLSGIAMLPQSIWFSSLLLFGRTMKLMNCVQASGSFDAFRLADISTKFYGRCEYANVCYAMEV